MANEFIARKGLISLGDSQITGSLEVTGSIKSTDSVWVGEDGAFKSSQPSTAGSTSGSYFDQSLQFFIPYRSDGTTIAENRSGLKLGGQLFFEPRTTNGTILYGFGTIGFKRTDGTGTGIGLSMGNTGTYPENSVTLSSWANFKNTSDRYFQVYGYFGHKFTINGGEVMRVNSTGLGLNTTSPSAKLHVIGTNNLSSNYAFKVQNSSGTDLLKAENDGKLYLRNPSHTSGDINSTGSIVHYGDLTLGPVTSNAPDRKLTIAGYDGAQVEFNLHNGWGKPTIEAHYGGTIKYVNYGNNSTNLAFQFGESVSRQGSMRFYTNSDEAIKFGTNSGYPLAYIGVVEQPNNYNGGLVIKSRNGTSIVNTWTFGRYGDLTTPGNINLSGSLIVSQSVSASTYYGDGSNLTGITGISFNGSTANGLVTYGSATTANVEANLTFDGSTFELQGASNFNIQANAFNFNGVPTGTDNTVLVLNSSDNIVTDEIDSRVWGTSLIDSSGFTMTGDIDMDGQTISMNGGEIMSGNDISAARFLAGNGSSATPSISFNNDTNTGIYLAGPDSMLLQAGGGTAELLINTSGVTVNNGTFAIPGISDVSASIAAASGGGGSAYHTWIGGRGQNTSQATYGTQWRGGMSGNALGGSFVVNADANLLTVSSGTPSVGDTVSANNYKIITTLIHPAMAFTTIDWYGHFRAYNSACDGNEQHMEIWTLDDVNDLVGFGTTTLTFRGGNQWTYDGTSATIKPIITSGSISHTGTETTAFVVVSHVPTNPASSMQFVYKFDFTVT